MLKLNRSFSVSLILVVALIMLGFTGSVNTAKDKLEAITEEIPTRWWEGGWDKIEKLEDFIQQYPAETELVAEAKYWIACNYRSQGETETALSQFQQIIYNYSRYPTIVMKSYFEIAQIYYFLKADYESAIEGYQKVIALSPSSWQAQYAQEYIGRCYMKMGNNEMAKAELEAAFKAGRASAGLAVAEIMLNEAEKLSSADPANLAYRDSQFRKAISYYKQLFELYPLEQDEGEVFVQIIDSIAKAFIKWDGNLLRANQFINYQKYGRAGKDGILGTSDDLTDPLAEF